MTPDTEYRTYGFEQVEGWCSVRLFEVLDHLTATQELHSDSQFDSLGGCLEIGVHHGKFYLLLNSFVQDGNTSVAVDVFDQQELNVDHSGSGSLARFRDNLLQFDRHRGANTKIIVGDSLDSAVRRQVRDLNVSFRFVSVDGGHTPIHAVADLQFAEEMVSNAGIVMLDDFLNMHWLGVMEGTLQYLSTRPTLVPFAIGYNKVFLCRLSLHQRYFDAMIQFGEHHKNITSLFGHRLVALE